MVSICLLSEPSTCQASSRLWGSQLGGLGGWYRTRLQVQEAVLKLGPATSKLSNSDFCCFICKSRGCLGCPLVAQWLRTHAPTCRDVSNPRSGNQDPTCLEAAEEKVHNVLKVGCLSTMLSCTLADQPGTQRGCPGCPGQQTTQHTPERRGLT